MGRVLLTWLPLLLMLATPLAAAIRINEVEINPPDGSNGIEWIELYNEKSESVDISGWEVWDGLKTPTKRATIPEGMKISAKGFYIVNLEKPVLNNGGDFVILYNNEGEEIDRTKTLKDQEWSEESWQLCGGEWVFEKPTKEEENICQKERSNEQEKTNTQEESPYENQTEENKNIIKPQNETKKAPLTLETIKLNTKDIKREENFEESSKENKYAKYGLILFCALLAILILIKHNKQKKNGLI